MTKYKTGDLVTIKLMEQDVTYLNDGAYSIYLRHNQIVKHEPAPFDWKDVKPGMAFETDENEYWIYFYNGKCVSTDEMLFSAINKKDGRKLPASIEVNCFLESFIRSEKHDIEVK